MAQIHLGPRRPRRLITAPATPNPIAPMSLRVLVKPDQITRWITERNGTPARRHGSDTDFRILFGESPADYQPVSLDELLDAMKFHHLVMLVDEQPGQTHHRIYRIG